MPTLPLPAAAPPGLALFIPPGFAGFHRSIFPPFPGLPAPIPPIGSLRSLPPGLGSLVTPGRPGRLGRVGRAIPGLPVEIPPGPPGFLGGFLLPVVAPKPGRFRGFLAGATMCLLLSIIGSVLVY